MMRGNITEQAFFDEHDRPVLIGDGYAKVTMSTDERGRTVEVAYFDAAGGLTTGEDRYARRRFKYDERGNRVEIAYLDAEGRPARSNNGNAGQLELTTNAATSWRKPTLTRREKRPASPRATPRQPGSITSATTRLRASIWMR